MLAAVLTPAWWRGATLYRPAAIAVVELTAKNWNVLEQSPHLWMVNVCLWMVNVRAWKTALLSWHHCCRSHQ